jgi:hypothetical protein
LEKYLILRLHDVQKPTTSYTAEERPTQWDKINIKAKEYMYIDTTNKQTLIKIAISNPAMISIVLLASLLPLQLSSNRVGIGLKWARTDL